LRASPYGERQTVVLVGYPGSPWWSGSQREYQTDLWHRTRPALILPFFMRGGAPLAHGSLAKKMLFLVLLYQDARQVFLV
jgi:hypothetical protein